MKTIAQIKFEEILEKAKKGTITINDCISVYQYAEKLTDKQLDWVTNMWQCLKTGKKFEFKSESEDILDSGLVYNNCFGSAR